MKVFTKREILEAEQSKNKLLYFASRYACKEAVFKCLKVDGNLIRLNEIEILNSEIGAPEVHLLENLKRISLDKEISGIEISLSFEDEYVMAYAVAQN